jgi:hypothetical protein
MLNRESIVLGLLYKHLLRQTARPLYSKTHVKVETAKNRTRELPLLQIGIPVAR